MPRGALGAIVFGIGLAGLLGWTFQAGRFEPAGFSFANGSEPKTLDPGLMTGAPEGRIGDAIFEGLTFRDPATLRPRPGVAERWEISPDGRRYVFHLREDAVWSDGVPVRASDFVYSWRRFLSPELGAEYAYLLHGVRHARALHQGRATAQALRGPARTALAALDSSGSAAAWRGLLAEHDLASALAVLAEGDVDEILRSVDPPGEGARKRLAAALERAADRHAADARLAEAHFGVDAGVYALDERTLVVELEAPIPYFLELVAFYPTFPVRRELVEARPSDWFLPERIVGNGPFRLEAWRVGDRIRLRRSPSYWGRKDVGVETIDALPVENQTTALNLYLTGSLDWLPDYPSDLVDALRDRPDHYSGPGFIVYYYRLNTTRPPLDDPRVRRALGLAIDRESIARDVLRMGQLPAHHLVPPGVPGYEPPPSGLGFDPELARRLLAEAGYPGGQGVREIGILYNTHEVHKKIAELVADQLRRNLGIPAKPYNQEWQSYLATVRQGEYDVARAGWIGDYLDPNTFLDLWVTNGGNNQTGWGHPDYDRLIRAAADVERFADDPELRGLREPGRARALLAERSAAPDAAARRRAGARLRLQLLREAEALLVQEGFPVIPVYFYVVSGLVNPAVSGFYSRLEDPDGTSRPNLQDLHPLRGIRVEGRP